MALDTNVFDKIKNFQDYQRADQEFQLRRAMAAQQAQTGNIDAASKANVYKTQLLSGAAAGGQGAYDQARQTLQQQGIDTSEYAPDIGTAGQQLNAARLAQSPLGSLITAGTKMTANDLAAVNTYGSMDKAVAAGYKPEGLALPNLGSFAGGNNTPVRNDFPAQPSAAPPVDVQPNNNSLTIPSANNTPIAPAPPGVTAPSIYGQIPTIPPAPSKFSPPKQDPGESMASYNSRVQQSFEAYKTDPSVLAAQEKAKKTALDSAEADKGSIASTETFGRLNQNLDALKTLNTTLPEYGGILPVSVTARAGLIGGKSLGDSGAGYNALQQWNEVNQQQVINAISELVKGGQIRGNQYIEKIINRGFAIDPDAPKATRDAEIETLRNELKNATVQAQNTSAAYTGAPKQDYVPTLPPQAPSSGIKFLGFK